MFFDNEIVLEIDNGYCIPAYSILRLPNKIEINIHFLCTFTHKQWKSKKSLPEASATLR